MKLHLGIAKVLLLIGVVCRGAVAADVPWTPQQVVEALSSDDRRRQDLAEGYLYLLPEASFPALAEVLDRRPDQHVEAWAKRITRALLLRGYQPVVKGYLTTRFPEGQQLVAYSLNDDQLLAQTTPDELAPLARAFAERLGTLKTKFSWGGEELWVRLAGITGEPALLHPAILLVLSPQGRFAEPKMVGGFDPDRCGELIMSVQTKLPKEEVDIRLSLVRLLRSGWERGPAPSIAALMRDGEVRIRSTFALTLNGSSSASALELIVSGLDDPDVMVRQACLSALGSFKGEPQVKLLRKLALDERVEMPLRQQAWTILGNLPGDQMLAEAKALVGNQMANSGLRQTAVQYVLRRDGSRWLLDAVPRLDSDMKASVLSTLAYSGSAAVLAEIPAFLRRAEPALAANVLSSLASLKDDKVLPLLIDHLKDVRPEVRRAAANALTRATGLSYQPPDGDEAEQTKATQLAWSRWYDQCIAPPPPAMVDDLNTMRTFFSNRSSESTSMPSLSGDAFPVLLRLANEKKFASKALPVLARLGDARAAASLIALVDSPGFSSRQDELTQALMITRVDPTQAGNLLRLLSNRSTQALAIRVLVAWRITSPALTAAILNSGNFQEDLLRDLLTWKDCPVISGARKLMTDDKSDERQRSLALAFIVKLADERDVKALSREVSEGGSASYLALNGLVKMACSDVDSAARELARLLQTSARKQPARPTRPLREKADKPDAEPPKPDPGPAIISALRGRPHSKDGALIPLPDPLPAAVSAWTRAAEEPQHRLNGLALLMDSGDPLVGEIVRDLLKSTDPAVIRQVFDQVTSSRRIEDRPYVDLLQDLPGLDDSAISQVIRWYRDVAKMSPVELRAVDTALQARQDAMAGKPVRGLVVDLDLEGTTAPLAAKGLKAKVRIRNTGKTPYTCFPEQFQFMLVIRRQDPEQTSDVTREVRPLFKSKPKAGGGTEPTVIAPGQTFSAPIVYDAPDLYFAASAHRVRLQWRVPRSYGSQDPDDAGRFTSRWQDYTYMPELWELIDRRYAGR